MNQRENHQKLLFRLKTLTPVHIASGNVLVENRDYYLHQDSIRRIDYPGLVADIPEDGLAQAFQQIRNEGVRTFLPKPRKKAEKPRVEEDWKQILRQKVGISAVEEAKEEQEEVENPHMHSLLSRHQLYEMSIDQTREDPGGKVQAMSVSPSQHAFLPGSTLKGAMRTALYVDSILREPERLDRLRFTWTNDPVEADYPLDREMSGVGKDDMSQDIFRNLWLRDSSRLPLSEALDFFSLRIMNIGGDPEAPPDRVVWKKGNQRNVSTYEEADSLSWEMIRPGVEFQSEVLIDTRQDEFRLAGSATEEAALRIDRVSLMRSLNAFAEVVAQREIEFAEKFQIPFLKGFYQDLLDKCRSASSENETTRAYMAIGSGLPWHAKTVGSLLDASSLGKIRRHFYRYMGKFVYLPSKTTFHGMRLRRGQLGGKPIRPEKLKSVDPFPKTRHFVFQNGHPAFPPGWVSIEI